MSDIIKNLGVVMANVLVRNLSDKTHRELKRQAKTHGRSVNAEVLAVLDANFEPNKSVGLGTELQQWKEKYLRQYLEEGEDFTFEIVRDKTPARYVDFSAPEFDVPEPE